MKPAVAGRRLILAAGAACMALHGGEAPGSGLSAAEIMSKVEAADTARKASLRGYTSTRHYLVENDRFHVKAAMTVQVEVDARGAKKFRVTSVSGPAAVRKLVFQRMLDTETRTSTPEGQSSTRISNTNYKFKLVEEEVTEGKRQYVLDAEPKAPSDVLFRGRIWVNADTFAVVKIDGAPAKNPSFWVSKTRFVHEYTNMGGQWMASVNRSESEIKVFGKSVVTIQYGDYKFEGESAH
jgi:hypothetical protein